MNAKIEDPSRWVLPEILLEQARLRPHQDWIETTDGDRMSFGQTAADARRVAGHLVRLGVGPGDMVAVMMPNGVEFVRTWLGIGMLGAIAVLLNTELRGSFLQHQLRNCGAGIAIVDRSLCTPFREAAAGVETLRRVAMAGPAEGFVADAGRSDLPMLDWADWKSAADYDGKMPRAADIACVMYTSGTSGPSKGALMPHAHCALYGFGTIEAVQLDAEDRYYIALPLFHANGLLLQLGASLLAGIPAVIRPRFSAREWLDDIRRYRCTVTNLLGATAAFILGRPPGANDRDHHLRAICSAPNLPEHEQQFHDRFGVRDVVSGYGSTEVNIPIWGRVGRPCPGAAGWVHARHFEVMIADPETDAEVARGQIGEILVRPKVPFGFMAGYLNMPDKTVEAWRNLWFHSGDAGIMHTDGLVTFVDRLKDCIRCRSENIAASEIEDAVATLPGIQEIAAYAVPSDIAGGEDEVMLAIVPHSGATLTFEDVVAHADRVLPRFAAPRYVEMLTELPKTATGKVQRAVLRKRGAGSAWDRSRRA